MSSIIQTIKKILGSSNTAMTDENPTVHKRTIPNKQIHLHETTELPDGTPVGRRGGLWYVLDNQKRAVSKGYHEIHPQEGEAYIGKIGNRSETFTVVNDGD